MHSRDYFRIATDELSLNEQKHDQKQLYSARVFTDVFRRHVCRERGALPN